MNPPSRCGSLIVVSVMLALAIAGCSKPAKLAPQIKDADRVVIAVTVKGAMLTLDADETKKLKEAVLSATRDRHHYPAMMEDRLIFYKGTNLIVALPLQDRIFSVDGKIYSDNSGLLKSLWEKALTDRFNP